MCSLSKFNVYLKIHYSGSRQGSRKVHPIDGRKWKPFCSLVHKRYNITEHESDTDRQSDTQIKTEVTNKVFGSFIRFTSTKDRAS